MFLNKTIESALANAIDAKKTWFKAALEENIKIHQPDCFEDYSGQLNLRIQQSLQRPLAEH